MALYAWHPLAVVEIAGSGHPEPLVLVPMLAALLLWDRRPRAGAGAEPGATAKVSMLKRPTKVPWA